MAKPRILKDGKHREYTEDGKLLSEFIVKNGMCEGIAHEYFPSGKISCEQAYIHGSLIREVWFDEDGMKRSESIYNCPKITVIERTFDKNGNLVSEKFFRNGAEIKIKTSK